MLNSSTIPMVTEKNAKGERFFDIYSFLLRNRIVFISGPVDDHLASVVCAQLIFLESEDHEKDVHLYINSPGGSVSAGMAIYDTMQFIKSDVNTWGIGMAASIGSLLLTGGAKGKRNILPNGRVMIHEPWGGYQGRSQHMEDHAKEAITLRENITKIYAHHTGQDEKKIYSWLNRETFFSSKEALELGFVDKIIQNRDSFSLNELKPFNQKSE